MLLRKWLRPISGAVLVTFTSLTLQPLTAAAQLPSPAKREPARSEAGEERYSRLLKEIHEILKEVVPQAAMPHRAKPATPAAPGKPGEKVLQAVGPKLRLESEAPKPLPGVDVATKVKALRAKYKELKSLEAEVMKGFKATEKHIRDSKLPAEILARQETTVAEYEKRKAEFDALMQPVESAADGTGNLQAALSNLGDFMAKYPNEKTHTPTDPNNLPWGSPKPVTRAPYTSPAQFKTSRLFGEPVKVAQAGSISGISLPNTTLPTTPNAGDLAATDDVQITQPIRDLATSLGNQPVAIYNWVRNNIQFVPSYGSIQGSDMTLQTKRGNSFDTASLLIALLRAAGVPARYVYGTIQVPVDKAMNWVGGVTAPDAVLNLLAQGGIPSRGVGSAGQMQSIQLEHVWVEAFVDYTPSRGAVNRSPNTWVPMDASFKQYQFTHGMDIKANVPFDAQSAFAQIQQGTTLNEAQGWLQVVNQTLLQQSLTDYQTRLTSYVDAKNPNSTVGDVLGTRTVVQENRTILLGTLPYAKIATGAKLQGIPDNLRWKFRFNLYASAVDRANESPTISLVQSTPQIAGKKLLLDFPPLSQADRDAITSFLPHAHADGTPIQPSELPDSLPGYLIRLGAELRVDGNVLMSGGSFNLGQEVIASGGFFVPQTGWANASDNFYTAGDLRAIGVDLQGVLDTQLQQLKQTIDQTKSNIDASQFSGFSIDTFPGNLLQSVVMGYFASVNTADEIAAGVAKVVRYRLPSFGTVGLVTQTFFFLGIPKAARPDGVEIDIDRLAVIAVDAQNSSSGAKAYLQLIGSRASTLEHLVPESAFQGQSEGEAVSGMKALGRAISTGQRIFLISSQNVDTALSAISAPADLESEILNSVSAGKQVLISESPVAVGPWSGFGYIVMDPDTGAGAYKISGGTNGGKITLALILTWVLFFAQLLIIFTLLVLTFISASPLFLSLTYLFVSLFLLDASKKAEPSQYKDFLQDLGQGFMMGALLILLLGGPTIVVPLVIMSLYVSVSIALLRSLWQGMFRP
jgi:transglutaminase-like putative cysteine protease